MLNIANIRKMQIEIIMSFFTSHWSEWPSFKALQMTNARADVEKREFCYSIGGD